MASTVASNGLTTANQVVPVTLGTVLFQDAFTGSISDVTSTWNYHSCVTRFYSAITNATAIADPCFFSSTSWRDLITASPSNMVCSGFVQSVSYTVNHTADSTGSINTVSADIIITDLADVVSTDTKIVTTQAFGISFESSSTGSRSTQNGNLVARKRSGNPGYIIGLPVLYAYTNGSVMAELKTGLTLPKSSSGLCPTSSSSLESAATAFGYDTISGCTLQLTRQQLKDFCCTGAAATCLNNAFSTSLNISEYTSSKGLPNFLNFSIGG